MQTGYSVCEHQRDIEKGTQTSKSTRDIYIRKGVIKSY